MQNSNLGSYNLKDFGHTLLITAGTAFLSGLAVYFTAQHLPTWPQLQVILITTGATAISVVLKKLATDSAGTLMGSNNPTPPPLPADYPKK